MTTLINHLSETEFLSAHLVKPDSSHGRQSYMGICKLEGADFHRRIDIKVYPRKYFAFALLYFTGSAHFNRSMRLFARKKGFSLSDKGLHPVIAQNFGQNGKESDKFVGESIPCDSEKEIFEALHLPYRLPSERNI